MPHVTLSGATVPQVTVEVGGLGGLHLIIASLTLTVHFSPEELTTLQAQFGTAPPIHQDCTTLTEAQVQAALADPMHPNAAALAWVQAWYVTPPPEPHTCNPGCIDWQEGMTETRSTGPVAPSPPGGEVRDTSASASNIDSTAAREHIP